MISVVTIPVSPNRLVTAPLSLSSLSWAMLLVSGGLTLLAFWWQVLAVYTCTHVHVILTLVAGAGRVAGSRPHSGLDAALHRDHLDHGHRGKLSLSCHTSCHSCHRGGVCGQPPGPRGGPGLAPGDGLCGADGGPRHRHQETPEILHL